MSLDLDHLLACPCCNCSLDSDADGGLVCPSERDVYSLVDGIQRFLTNEAQERLAPFIRSYEDVRRAEGRGSNDPNFYRSLPYPVGLGRAESQHWARRARSYERLIELLPKRSSTLLDLGAGNGWLSNRLASRGHRVIAVDLQTNEYDGLGCRNHYQTEWLAVQATFEALPIQSATIDAVIFNASLHYSASLNTVLREAARVITPAGSIFILDSPVYSSDTAGQTMLKDQAYAVPIGIGYLTRRGILEASEALSLTTEPYADSSIRTRAVRLLKRLYLKREPARMPVIQLCRNPEK